MKDLIIFIFAILCVFLVSYGTAASNLDISGNMTGQLKYITESEKINDFNELKLNLEKSFNNADTLVELSFYYDHLQNMTTSIKKMYLDYYTDNIDWRLGKQLINWGSSYKINPTSYFTALDLSSFASLETAEGINAVRGTYYFPSDFELSGVVAPFTRESGGNIEDMQFGMKLTRRYLYNYDLSVSAFSGQDNFPIYIPGRGISYPDAVKYGFDLTGSISDIATWVEMVYNNYDNKQYDNIIEGTVGGEYKFQSGINMIGQFYYRDNRFPAEAVKKLVSFNSNGPLGDFHKWELTLLYDQEGKGVAVKPEIQYSLTEAVWLNIGFLSTGQLDDGNYSKLLDMVDKNIYTNISIDF